VNIFSSSFVLSVIILPYFGGFVNTFFKIFYDFF